MVELEVETKNRLKSRLKRKLGFLEDKAKEAVAAYEEFLNLLINVKDFHAQKLLPPPIIDQVWQLHVLDTINYEVDCIGMCGCIIHYNPDLDVDLGSSERDVRQMSTNIAYEAKFGETLSKRDAWKFDASVPNLPAYNDKTGQKLVPERVHSIERGKKSGEPAKRALFSNVQECSPSKKKIISIDLTKELVAAVENVSISNSVDGKHNVIQTEKRTNSLQNLSHASSTDKSSCSVKITLTEDSNVMEMDATKSVKVTATNGEAYIVYIDKTSKLVDVRSAINSHGSINAYLCRLWTMNGERVSSHFYTGALLSYGFKNLHLEVPSSKNTSEKKVLTPQRPIEVFALSPSLIPATFNLAVKGNGNVVYKIKVTQNTTVEDIKELFISTFNIKFALLKYLCPNQAQMIKQLFTIQFDSRGELQRIYAHEGWTVKNVKAAIMPYLPLPDSDIALFYDRKRLDEEITLEQTGVQKGSSFTVLPAMNDMKIKLQFC